MPIARASSAPLPSTRHCFDCVVVGAECVGKTALLQRACWSQFSRTYAPTVGTEYYSMICSGRQLSIWEAGGQERYAPVHVQSLRRAQALIFVFDATSGESLRALLERAPALRRVAQRVRVCMLVATKMDLTGQVGVGAATLQRAKETLGTEGYFETSAATGMSTSSVFTELVDALERRRVEPASIKHLRHLPDEAPPSDAEYKFNWTATLRRLSCGCIGDGNTH